MEEGDYMRKTIRFALFVGATFASLAFAGSALAAFVYDFVAHPRIVTKPITEAVTHPDPGPAVAAK